MRRLLFAPPFRRALAHAPALTPCAPCADPGSPTRNGHSKIYLTLTRRTDPDEALASAQRDWDADTNGGGKDARIGRDAFCRSWFELADVNTHTMEEAT